MGVAIPWRLVSWLTGIDRHRSEWLSYALTPFLVLGLVPLVSHLPLKSFCIVQHLTGIPCPACGITRSLDSLLRGEISPAWAFNPCGWLVLLALGSQVVATLLEVQETVGSSARFRAARLGDAVVTVGLLLVWVMRLAGVLSVPPR
jgi:hypothetical protein